MFSGEVDSVKKAAILITLFVLTLALAWIPTNSGVVAAPTVTIKQISVKTIPRVDAPQALYISNEPLVTGSVKADVAIEDVTIEVSPTTDGFVESIVSIHIYVEPENATFSGTYSIISSEGDVIREEEIEFEGFYGAIWDTTTIPDGEYTVNVTGVDYLGNRFTDAVTVKVDNTPPEITFVTPANGSSLLGTVVINFTITDLYLETEATLRIDAVEIALTVTSGTPVLYTWDTTEVGDGVHTIVVTARDALREASASLIVETLNYIKIANSALTYGILLGLPLGLGIGVIISFALAKAMIPKKLKEEG
jgi:hypothetical protein